MRISRSLTEASANACTLHQVLISHCEAIKLGTLTDNHTANTILSFYTKCRQLLAAHVLFDEMSSRDTVSWNSMISGYINCGNFCAASDILISMNSSEFRCNAFTFGSVLKGIAQIGVLHLGQQVHSAIIKMGYEEDVYSIGALVNMYAKCARVHDAFMLFKSMKYRNFVTWNALICGFVQEDDIQTSFQLLGSMEMEGVKPSNGTFAPLLTLLNQTQYYALAKAIHARIFKLGLSSDTTLSSATITSYSKCGSLEDAQKVFYHCLPDLSSWNSMIGAFVLHGCKSDAFEFFLEMQMLGFVPDLYTYISLIHACCIDDEHNLMMDGRALHGLVIKQGVEKVVLISNALMAMYLKGMNGKHVEDGRRFFEFMDLKDKVSWNSFLTGLSNLGLGEDALKIFRFMRSQHTTIDRYAFSAVLRSCSDLATLQLGQQVHVLALKSGLDSNRFVASSLISMYSKCGMIKDARKSFEGAIKDSAITWNSIIFACGHHGDAEAVMELFNTMSSQNIRPDHVTFVALLTSCSHNGMVEEGCRLLKSMESHYGIPLRAEHYACAIDLYGRAGRIREARNLLETMRFEPSALVLRNAMNACRLCGDLGFAARIAMRLVRIDPEDDGAYVVLSGIYGARERWDDKARILRLMRERGLNRACGCSWIEVDHGVHVFRAEDLRSHHNCKEILLMLGELMHEVKNVNDYLKY